MAKNKNNKANPEKVDQPGTVAKVKILNNALDYVQSATYHFRLIMLDSKHFKNTLKFSDALNANEYRVIAESGNPQFSMDNVTIETMPGVTVEYNSGTALNFKFTVREPLGATFLDTVYKYAHELKIKNYFRAPYFLELTFLGRNPKNDSLDSLPFFINDTEGGDFKNVKWVWPIIITQMQSNISSKGTEYNFTAMNYSDIASVDKVADSPHPITLRGVKVKDFLKSLQTERNKIEEKRKGKFQSEPDVYTIVAPEYEDDIVDLIREDSALKNADNDDTPGISFADGTDIQKIIEAIIQSSSSYLKNADDFKKKSENKNEKSEDFVKEFFRIYTDVSVIENKFDTIRNDYPRHYVYIVKKCKVIVPIITDSSDLNDSDKRIEYLGRQEYILKAYNYLYTGVNQQVLNFDLNFNFSWFVPFPTHAGIYKQLTGQQNEQLKQGDTTTNPPAPNQQTGTQGGPAQTSTNTQENQTYNEYSTIPQANLPLQGIGFNDGTGVLTQDRLLLSALYTQNTASARDLVSVDLKIKGDPFWLTTPISNDGYVITDRPYIPSYDDEITKPTFDRDNVFRGKLKVESADFPNWSKFDKNLCFVFTVRTPSLADPDTGLVTFTDSNIISGVYIARKVVHEFSNGLFTQTIQAIRDVGTDWTKVKKSTKDGFIEYSHNADLGYK